MSELSVIENLEAERKDLSLHVDLCAQRYTQLIIKFDEVDRRLDQLAILCSEIKDSINNVKANTQSIYLKWAGFMIITLSGIVGGLIGHLI